MPRKCHPFASIFQKIQAVRSGSVHTLMATGRVTVLLFFLASNRTLYAQDSNGAGLRVFEFRCEFRMPIAPGHVDGLVASNGHRQRIAIYWIEPALFREASSFLRCYDLIFDRDRVHYWIQGMSQPGTLRLSDAEKDPLLPVQKAPESILRSALAIVNQIRGPRDEADTALEVATFFEKSRGRTEYKYEILPSEAGSRPSSSNSVTGARVLDALPFGRKYSKETRDDGSVVWWARKASNGSSVASVTIHRVRELGPDSSRAALDEQTLGQWALIREPYGAYWSFDRTLAGISASSDVRTSSRDLYGKLISYLDQNSAPPEVGRALDRLRFQAALMTADSNCVWQSAQAVVTRLCADDTVPKLQCVMDLGGMSGQIQKQYPEQMEEQLPPLVARVVRHAGQDACAGVNRLMADIVGNDWFTYGELLLAEMRREGLMEAPDMDSWTAKLQASRSAKGVAASDSSDLPASVRQYLSQLDAAPPRGVMDLNDVRCALNEGLAKRFTPEQSEAKREIVENAIRSIHLIAGDGPFRGDPEKLIGAIDSFSHNCLDVNKSAGSFDTVLATFVALSFWDTSTPEDHQRLSSQLQHCSRELQSRVNTRLAARGLGALVTPEDVERTFQVYERRFQEYIDDPLWPAFKFPWTVSEEGRLMGALRLRLTQLEPVLEEMSLKVKYGGASEELKDKTVRAISVAAQELLPQAAFLRMPLYPGVSCRYYRGYGFSVAIQGPLYQEGDRPKEKFRAMKYFHLGHRLEEVVKGERELTRPSKRGDEP
ncbi:MAG: hypothetical protein NTZ17_11475 [Phycisphaerae bacterium]|nr:hypothetical protein [Phycisphaerae bacterium]